MKIGELLSHTPLLRHLRSHHPAHCSLHRLSYLLCQCARAHSSCKFEDSLLVVLLWFDAMLESFVAKRNEVRSKQSLPGNVARRLGASEDAFEFDRGRIHPESIPACFHWYLVEQVDQEVFILGWVASVQASMPSGEGQSVLCQPMWLARGQKVQDLECLY